jgi:hypothetical protein
LKMVQNLLLCYHYNFQHHFGTCSSLISILYSLKMIGGTITAVRFILKLVLHFALFWHFKYLQFTVII